jgi:hypothetical protein
MKTLLVMLLITLSITSLPQNLPNSSDKTQYSILNATPVNRLRSMETDRPDVTESSYTVDAGHFQYEGDLSRLTISQDGGVKNRKVVFNNGTYKMGITNSFDLHVVFESYILSSQNSNQGCKPSTAKGLGDVVVRGKKNVIGNDSGKFSLAILPFVKLPTGSFYKNNHIEGGVIFPYTINNISDWSIGGEVEVQLLNERAGHTYKAFLLQSFVVEHELTKRIAFFAETHFTYSEDLKRFENFANGGLILFAGDNLHFDCGFNYGIQSYAYKSYFVGMSFRK